VCGRAAAEKIRFVMLTYILTEPKYDIIDCTLYVWHENMYPMLTNIFTGLNQNKQLKTITWVLWYSIYSIVHCVCGRAAEKKYVFHADEHLHWIKIWYYKLYTVCVAEIWYIILYTVCVAERWQRKCVSTADEYFHFTKIYFSILCVLRQKKYISHKIFNDLSEYR